MDGRGGQHAHGRFGRAQGPLSRLGPRQALSGYRFGDLCTPPPFSGLRPKRRQLVVRRSPAVHC